MRRILLSACAVSALAALSLPAAAASDLDNFARLSWSGKVRLIKAAGGTYRRDCSAVLSGQPGADTCLHITELSDDQYMISVRAAMASRMRQWCMARRDTGRMVCTNQDTGHTTMFVRMGDMWRSVN